MLRLVKADDGDVSTLMFRVEMRISERPPNRTASTLAENGPVRRFPIVVSGAATARFAVITSGSFVVNRMCIGSVMVGTNLLSLRTERLNAQHFIENRWATKVTYLVFIVETSHSPAQYIALHIGNILSLSN
jgi:hypothetical protein